MKNTGVQVMAGGIGEYRLVAVEPLLEVGYQTWPLPTDRRTVVGVSPNTGTMLRCT